MNVVKFPGLNLDFKFSKIAFNILGIEIYKYACCIIIGIIVALFLARVCKKHFEVEYDFIIESFISSIFFGIIGARLYYVIFNLKYYSKNVLEIFNIRNGGLAIYGGLIFGTIAVIMNCKIHKKSIINFLDYIVPFVAIAQAIGRFGNFFNIEAYGTECNNFLRMGINTVNGYIEVHPTFLYESISDFLIFFILLKMQQKRKFKGQIFLLYCILYSFIRAIIENFRTDSLMFMNSRVSQILSIIIFMISFIAYLVELKNKCRKMSYEK